jgi:hypothetical protein
MDLYVLDFEGYDQKTILDAIHQLLYNAELIAETQNVKSIEIDNWDEDHPLNQLGNEDTYSNYF